MPAALAVSLFLFWMAFAGLAQAQTFSVLHAFKDKPDGSMPYGGVVRDAAGNLYGTTDIGGRYGAGTIYKIDSAGKETVLHSFSKPEGAGPMDSLLLDAAGNLYGTAHAGGYSFGLGTVFELKPGGHLKVLHRFGQNMNFDASGPYGGLVRDGVGNLYGEAGGGTTQGGGAVYKVDHLTGAETIVYNFGPPPDGGSPLATLARDPQGNLYGTTNLGGANCLDNLGCGTVFKVDSSGNETVLYNFTGGTDGKQPVGGVVLDEQGNIFGTTSEGGLGFGTVFKLDPNGGLTVLHSFGQSSPDGAQPFAGLTRDSRGSLYGTTYLGGAFGYGSVYKLDANGNFSVLHSFTWGTDGRAPWAGVILDQAGNIYGTTQLGGDQNCDFGNGCGVVFKITP